MQTRLSSGQWTIGHIGGAPIEVAPVSALMAVMISSIYAPWFSAWGTVTLVVCTIGVMVGLMASVTAHEVAHGLVSTILGRPAQRYELLLWGGRTTFMPAPRTWRPWRDALTTLSGPAVNLLLWRVLLWLGFLSGTRGIGDGALTLIFVAVAWLNLVLGIFNLMPALPLDGGFALAAIVTQMTGKRRTGLVVAAWGGVLTIVGALGYWVLYPLLAFGQRPSSTNLIMLIFAAWIIGTNSRQVLAPRREQPRQPSRSSVLERHAQPTEVVTPHTPLSQVRRDLIGGLPAVLVAVDSSRLGIIDREMLAALTIPVAQEASVEAGQVCQVLPPEAITSARNGEALLAAVAQARSVSRWLVVARPGQQPLLVPTRTVVS